MSVSRNNEIIVKFVINNPPSAIKLSLSASGQRQGRAVWIEKCYANDFQVLAFLFPKCARTDHALFLSRIELISFLSSGSIYQYSISFSVTFCCCLCDCRIPKTGYEKEDESKHDSDCSDSEPVAAPSRPPQGGKKLANGSDPQVTQEQKAVNTGHTPGEVNKAFDNEEGIVPQTESWRGIQRVTLSREP